jgi:hypothetical protein
MRFLLKILIAFLFYLALDRSLGKLQKTVDAQAAILQTIQNDLAAIRATSTIQPVVGPTK